MEPVARREFPIVIAVRGAAVEPKFGSLSAAYVLFLAILRPLLARAVKSSNGTVVRLLLQAVCCKQGLRISLTDARPYLSAIEWHFGEEEGIIQQPIIHRCGPIFRASGTSESLLLEVPSQDREYTLSNLRD